ncbi:hypothetical protein [Bowdeniella massiliensis]|uniref:hypothetical protein n=1 Tax=Bowdeniella massiliensis TaxID=2932264 RepID=UPI0020296EF7|nr:hypothetical protein [Bowdeniella massiliensis]
MNALLAHLPTDLTCAQLNKILIAVGVVVELAHDEGWRAGKTESILFHRAAYLNQHTETQQEDES